MVGQNETGVDIMKNGIQVPQNITNETSIRYSNPSIRYLFKGNELNTSKFCLYPHCLAALLATCELWKQHINLLIKKM